MMAIPLKALVVVCWLGGMPILPTYLLSCVQANCPRKNIPPLHLESSLVHLMCWFVSQYVGIFFIYIDGITPIDLKKRKIFHLADKLLLHNMAASSGLR